MSALKHATVGSPYRVPPEPRRWSAIMLAVAMHALLAAFLVIGISWQNDKPAAVEAEVWDMKVQSAAPPPPPPQAEPQPEPEPAPPPPAPKVVEPPAPPAPAPDIKLQQEKKHKEELRKLAEEKKAREEQKAKELADKKAQEEAKAEAEKKEAEKKAKEEKLKAEKAKAAALAKLKAQTRQQEMQRMMAQAGAGTSGTAAKSTAPRMDSGYEAAIRAKIKSNTTYPGSTEEPGNPKASFRVEQLPTGEILSVTKIKSSGVPSFDDAVERGIHKSTPLPKKKDGTVERTLVVDFSMKDMN